MRVRGLCKRDIESVQDIGLQYLEQFDIGELYDNHFISKLVVVDEKDDERVIVAGGLRTIVEAVIVTDTNFSHHKRIRALREFLGISKLTCQNNGYHELTAFIQDQSWLNQLLRAGFSRTKGDSVVICTD